MLKTISTDLDPTSYGKDSGKKPDFTKPNSSRTNFLIPKAQIAFI